MAESNVKLLERLSSIRTVVRRRLVLYGLCAVGSGGVLALSTIIFLDWLLWLPGLLRVLGGVLFFIGFALACWHWVVQPLRTRLSLNAVAGKLERHFRDLGDSLTSAVSFLEAPALGSPALMRQVIERTGSRVDAVELEGALTLRPLAGAAMTLTIAVLLAGAIAWMSPDWYPIGLARYAHPFRDTEWPRRVQIVFDRAEHKVALGDSLTVRMRIARGMSPDLRGIVKVRDAGGTVSSFAMHREGEDDFYFTLDGIGGDMAYWFEAGDDDTSRRPCRVKAEKRPAVVEVAARVDAPAYAQPRAPVEVDLSTGTVHAAAGSTLTFAIRSSKPVGLEVDGGATAWLDFGPERTTRLEPVEGDPTRLTAAMPVWEGGSFRILLRDQDGFENEARRDYELVVEPDDPPIVTVVEPAALTEVTPNGSLDLAVRAEDDFGIQSIRLSGELLNGGRPVEVPLYERGSDPSSRPAHELGGTAERATTEVRQRWDINQLALRPGDVVVYRAVAADIFAQEGAPTQTGSSPPLRLKVIGAAEFESRLRDEFSLLEKRVRQSVAQQEALRDELVPLARRLEQRELMPPAQVEQARRTAERQYRLAQRVADAADRFARIGERMKLNQAFDQETRGQVADMTSRLRKISADSMTEAARALDGVASATGAEGQKQQVTLAESRQTSAVEELQEVIRWMGRWGDFQEVVARTRDLLDRQQEVRATTVRQGAETVGAAVETLTDEQKAALRANWRDQQQLAREMTQWLRNAAAVAERVAAKDPAAADALAQALRLAGAQQVLQRMENAAEAVGANRTAGAALEQRAAETGLAAVLAALEARQARELAELTKNVERLLDAVKELLRQQEGLLTANEEAAQLAAGAEVFARMADEQRALRRNTQQLSEQAGDSPSTAGAGKGLEDAAEPMEAAEKELNPPKAADAANHQREAVALLQEVLEWLQQLAEQTQHRLMQASLAVTRRKLDEVRAQQEEVNVQSGELAGVVKSQGKLDRAGARRASKLAGKQGEIQGVVDGLGRDLERAAVYRWVLERVSEGMKSSGGALSARKIDDVLLENQQEILTQLERLIDALASLEALPPPDKFADAAGGGADGGPGAQNQPPVPPVAELIVLKAMQESLRDRTISLQKSWPQDEPTEADLVRARKLGEEQEQLRVMTEQVTRQAREGD